MSLFPGYGGPGAARPVEFMTMSSEEEGAVELSPESERALLAEPDAPFAPARPAPAAAPVASVDFYVDRKLDRGNLRVSTLYYPARPEYRARESMAVGGKGPRPRPRPRRAARYWRRAPPPDEPARGAAELQQRRAAFRAALQLDPANEDLWMHYIDFLEWCGGDGGGDGSGGGGEGAGAAAEAGSEAERVAPPSARAALRARTHAALRRSLSPHALADALSDIRAHEKGPGARSELWARELSARACAEGAAGARAGAAAAAADRAAHSHYHNVLHVYACILHSADLWEELTQLVELSVALLLGGGAFPPPRDPAAEARAERQLADWEATTTRAGLPLSSLWARVERARSALQWRAPAPGAAGADDALALAADPQRAPAPAPEVLPPAHTAAAPRAAPRALAALLRAAEVPLLPAAEYVARALAGCHGAAEVSSDWECSSGLALVALLRCARRLPPAHPASHTPLAARRLLAATSLRTAHTLLQRDNTGFEAWRGALWEASLRAVTGRARLALLCWRLRELHARVLLAQGDEEAVRRLRLRAREALKAWAGDAALPFAVFARLEQGAGRGQGEGRALRAALGAARRAAAPCSAATHEDRLYIARVVCEVGLECGRAGAAAGRWAVVAAVRGALPLPTGERLAQPPPTGLVQEALAECEERCTALEAQFASCTGDDDESLDAMEALLPGAGEWAAARAVLAPPDRLARLVDTLLKARSWRGFGAARWREQSACALVAAGAGAGAHATARTAAALLPLAPLNAYLALMSSEQPPLWSAGAGGVRGVSCARTELCAWAALLPAALRAADADFTGPAGARLERACARAARGVGAGAAGGALLHALRLRTAARPHLAAPLALAAVPHHKGTLVLAAAYGGAEAAALCELALERGLRLRTLTQELAPLPSFAVHQPELQQQQQGDAMDTINI